MTMRKMLALLLCICAVISVMAVVARSIEVPQAAAQSISTDPTTTTAAPTTTTEKPLGDRISESWEKIKPYFDAIYKFGFQGISQLLVTGFQWLLSLVGLSF